SAKVFFRVLTDPQISEQLKEYIVFFTKLLQLVTPLADLLLKIQYALNLLNPVSLALKLLGKTADSSADAIQRASKALEDFREQQQTFRDDAPARSLEDQNRKLKQTQELFERLNLIRFPWQQPDWTDSYQTSINKLLAANKPLIDQFEILRGLDLGTKKGREQAINALAAEIQANQKKLEALGQTKPDEKRKTPPPAP